MNANRLKEVMFFSRSEPATAITTMFLANRDLPVEVREHPRARRLTMRLNKRGDGVKVSVPPGTRRQPVEDFLQKHEGWVVARFAEKPQAKMPIVGGTIPFNGMAHIIIHHTGRGTSHVRDGMEGPELHVFGDPAHLKRRVRDFLKREARKELERLSHYHAERLGLKFKRLQIKDTTSRWGSCSSDGTLSYSWRIIMAEPDVLNYLVAHEVSHLKEMNHSHRFWAVVKNLCPDYERLRGQLKRGGSDLHAWQFD